MSTKQINQSIGIVLIAVCLFCVGLMIAQALCDNVSSGSTGAFSMIAIVTGSIGYGIINTEDA